MLSFAKRFLVVVAIVVALTDLIVFYHMIGKVVSVDDFPLVVSVIVITIIPVAVILWYWIPKYKLRW